MHAPLNLVIPPILAMLGLFMGSAGLGSSLLTAIGIFGALVALARYSPWLAPLRVFVVHTGLKTFGLAMSIFALAAILGSWAGGAGRPSSLGGLGLPAEDIRIVEGKLCFDALYGRRGDIRLELDLLKVGNGLGRSGSAQGRMVISIPGGESPYATMGELMKGTIVRLKLGSFISARGASLIDRSGPRGIDGIRAVVLNTVLGQGQIRADTRGGALWFALLLGRQDLLDPAISESFYRSGCAHVLALSGMHLSLLGSLLVIFVAPLIGPRKALFFSMLGAGLFVFLTGPYPSVLRALGMLVLQWACQRYRARSPLLSVLSFSAPLCVLLSPGLVHEAGFWLSCGALGGIALFAEPCSRLLVPAFKTALGTNIAAGIAASLGASPFLLYYGLPIYPQGIVASLFLGPLSLIHLAAGFICLFMALIASLVQHMFPLAGLLSESLGQALLEAVYQVNLHVAGWFC